MVAKCDTEILPVCDGGLQGPDADCHCGLLFFSLELCGVPCTGTESWPGLCPVRGHTAELQHCGSGAAFPQGWSDSPSRQAKV